MITLSFFIWWGILFAFTIFPKRHWLLWFFVTCQFTFIGLGLGIFSIYPSTASALFPDLYLVTITTEDYQKAHALILTGSTTVIAAYFILTKFVFGEVGNSLRTIKTPSLNRNTFYLSLIPVVLLSIPFVFQGLLIGKEILGMNSSFEIFQVGVLRNRAISNYLEALFVYNVVPAFGLVCVIAYLSVKNKFSLVLTGLVFVLVSLLLFVTIQKRPLIIFWALCFFSWWFYNSNVKGNIGTMVPLVRVMFVGGILAFVFLFVSYYLYTGYRFDLPFMEAAVKIIEALFSRIFGRLALPAAMYIDYFPSQHSFYGLSNVGLISKIFGTELYYDTWDVFNYYHIVSGGVPFIYKGTVASSLFLDAFGQQGFVMVFPYGIIVGFGIASFSRIGLVIKHLDSRAYWYATSGLFLYYLSQASLFRSLLGYGWVFFAIIWVVMYMVKTEKR